MIFEYERLPDEQRHLVKLIGTMREQELPQLHQHLNNILKPLAGERICLVLDCLELELDEPDSETR